MIIEYLERPNIPESDYPVNLRRALILLIVNIKCETIYYILRIMRRRTMQARSPEDYTSGRAQEAIVGAMLAKSEGDDRQEARNEKRAKSKEVWSARWTKVKEFGSKAWDKVKGVTEIPGKLVDGADALRTRAEVGYNNVKAELIQKGFDITNNLEAKMTEIVGFVESLQPRAEAKFTEVKLAALKKVAETIKTLIETAQETIRQAQESGDDTEAGEATMTTADRLRDEAADKRAKAEQAKANPSKLQSFRNGLRAFWA